MPMIIISHRITATLDVSPGDTFVPLWPSACTHQMPFCTCRILSFAGIICSSTESEYTHHTPFASPCVFVCKHTYIYIYNGVWNGISHIVHSILYWLRASVSVCFFIIRLRAISSRTSVVESQHHILYTDVDGIQLKLCLCLYDCLTFFCIPYRIMRKNTKHTVISFASEYRAFRLSVSHVHTHTHTHRHHHHHHHHQHTHTQIRPRTRITRTQDI